MEKEFLKAVTELLHCERSVQMEDAIIAIKEWDSLTMVSFAAMIMEKYNRLLTSTDILKARTIRDLYELVFVGADL